MGTTADKLNKLNQTKTAIKEALETPYNVFADYPALIKKYVDNQPTNTVSDGVCTNALDVPVKEVGIDGNSYQGENPSPDYPQDIEDIDGVNLFDKNNATYKNYKLKNDKGQEVNTPLSGYTTSYVSVNPNVDYIIKGSLIDSGHTFGIYFYDKNQNWISRIVLIDTVPYQFKTPNNCYYIQFQYIVNVYDERTIQITKGTTPKPYLPHGCIGLEQSGKNKLKNTLITQPITKDGVTISYINGYFVLNGTAVNGTYFDVKIDYEYGSFMLVNIENVIKQQTLDNYTLSANITNGKVHFGHNTSNGIWSISTISGQTYNNAILKIQLEEGATATDIEPYHEPKVIPINLNGNTLAKVGTVRDKLKIYRSGKVELIKNKARHIFTGDENFSIHEDGTERRRFALYIKDLISDVESGRNSICNYFINMKYNERYDIGYYYLDVDFIVFGDNNNHFANLDEFKTWLSTLYNAGTPVYVDYALAEPQTIQLPSIDPIELWEGTNNFKLITNLDTTFEMEYVVKI